MVLVDTSIWIRLLANHAPHAQRLDQLLARDEVLGHELVHGELLIGATSRRAALLVDYVRMEQAPVVQHDEVVAFVKARALAGRGIGWIDAQLLASALVGRSALCTADAALAKATDELGVAYVAG